MPKSSGIARGINDDGFGHNVFSGGHPAIRRPDWASCRGRRPQVLDFHNAISFQLYLSTRRVQRPAVNVTASTGPVPGGHCGPHSTSACFPREPCANVSRIVHELHSSTFAARR